MSSAVIDSLERDPDEGLTRAELIERAESLRRLDAAKSAYEARLIRAIDDLDDNGLDGRGMLRSHCRVAGKTAHRIARTAHGIA